MRPTGNCRPARALRETGFFLLSLSAALDSPLAPLPEDRPLAPLPDMVLAWRKSWVPKQLGAIMNRFDKKANVDDANLVLVDAAGLHPCALPLHPRCLEVGWSDLLLQVMMLLSMQVF